MTKPISVTTASYSLAAIAVALLVVACGKPPADPLPVDNPEIPVEQLRAQAERREGQVSRAAQRFAPEMLLAAEALLEEAAEASDETLIRERLAKADQYLRGAEAVAAVASQRRTLVFPDDRSLGELSISSWGEPAWRPLGPAQGKVTFEPETMVALQVNSAFNDDDLRYLAELGPGAVQYLMLGLTKVTEDGLAHLSDLVGLRDLSLAEARYGDDALTHIAACRALRHLNILRNEISDSGLHALAGMPALEDLVLGDSAGISDHGLFTVTQLPRLRIFVARQIHMTDVGIDYLSRVSSLELVWICGRGVTDFAVPMLSELEQLEELVLLQTSVTESGRRALKKALPDCNIDVLHS